MFTELKVYITIDSPMDFIYSFKSMCQARMQVIVYSDVNMYVKKYMCIKFLNAKIYFS